MLIHLTPGLVQQGDCPQLFVSWEVSEGTLRPKANPRDSAHGATPHETHVFEGSPLVLGMSGS